MQWPVCVCECLCRGITGMFSLPALQTCHKESLREGRNTNNTHTPAMAQKTPTKTCYKTVQSCVYILISMNFISTTSFLLSETRKSWELQLNWSSPCYVRTATDYRGKISLIYIDKQRHKVLLKLVHCPVRTSNNKDFFFRYRALKKTWQHRKSYKYLTSETDDIYFYKRKLKHEWKIYKINIFRWLFFLYCFSPFEHLHLAKNIYVNRASSNSKAHT